MTPDRNSAVPAVLYGLGLVYILTGLVCNRWVLGNMLSPDGRIDNAFFNLIIWVFELGAIGWGGATILWRRKPVVQNLNVLLVSLFVLSPLCGEALIRAGILLDVSAFRRPELYADQFADDDYWKLHHEWIRTEGLPAVGSVDTLLGWAPPRTPENPLGIIADTLYAVDPHGQSVLFYGDSFVEGVTPPGTQIPQRLARFLPGSSVYNYGVGGFGVDQIFLRFRSTHPLFHDPTIVFGILTEDLYRSVLSVRTGPKPFFVVQDDTLSLQGVPVGRDPAEWLRQNPPQIRSYLLAFVTRKLRSLRGGDREYRRSDIERVNALIIQEVVREARKHRLPLLFVSFYARWELQTSEWHELFLKEQFARWSVPFVDTKEVLLDAARRDSVDVSEYYYPVNGHLNERGNELVSHSIAEYIAKGRLGPPHDTSKMDQATRETAGN
jgi:hypothetical protein